MNMSIGPTIHVTQFTAKTFEEWQKALVKCFHSEKRMKSCKAGDIMVGTLDNVTVVVVGILKGVCTPCDLIDLDTYSGEDAKYNKYQFHLESYRILSKPVRFEDIRTYCGAPVDDKTPNNLFKGMQYRAEAFYNKKGESSIYLDRYRDLIAWWLLFPTRADSNLTGVGRQVAAGNARQILYYRCKYKKDDGSAGSEEV